MRLWMMISLGWTLIANSALAVAIDTFDEGALAAGPEMAELQLTQQSLPTPDVIGGGREWFVLYGGSLLVNESDSGLLQLNHDRDPFEVAILRYGKVVDDSTLAPLNADLTIDGHSQITLRIKRSSGKELGNSAVPLEIRFLLRSGVEGAKSATAMAVVRPIVSEEPSVLQLPFHGFSSTFGALDFSDIDGIDVSFFFQGQAEIEIDAILTSAGLPGDYNLNGAVDAADYTVWQDHRGQVWTLPNENPDAQTSGVVDDEDFEFWQSRFGSTFPTSNLNTIAVPESTTASLLLAAALIATASRLR